MSQVKQVFAITAVRAAVIALLVGVSGCSSVGSLLPDDKIDYRGGAKKVAPLDVPPDLTPLAREGRFAVQSGTVSASELGKAKPAAAATGQSVAINQNGDMRIERKGEQRWVVSSRSPEQLWPLVRQFWLDRGFKLTQEDATTGLIETDWAENRAKLPDDLIRSSIGKLFDSFYSTGERDRFRTRLERSGSGTEIYVSHRGLEEVYAGRERDSGTVWAPRATDPALEAELLTRMMVSLGSSPEAAKSAVANASAERATKARIVAGEAAATLQVDDEFERTWRRVGLALDRSGFTVEERDRTGGTYLVRYVDPSEAGKDGPNFIQRWFGAKDPAALALGRYRVQVKPASAGGSNVTVQRPTGEPDNGPSAQRIVTLLVEELKY